MEKREKKTALKPCADWLSCTFPQNRPRWINVYAGLSDFLPKFTRGSGCFFDPRVNRILSPVVAWVPRAAVAEDLVGLEGRKQINDLRPT